MKLTHAERKPHSAHDELEANVIPVFIISHRHIVTRSQTTVAVLIIGPDFWFFVRTVRVKWLSELINQMK